jgi:hypothetical protein
MAYIGHCVAYLACLFLALHMSNLIHNNASSVLPVQPTEPRAVASKQASFQIRVPPFDPSDSTVLQQCNPTYTVLSDPCQCMQLQGVIYDQWCNIIGCTNGVAQDGDCDCFERFQGPGCQQDVTQGCAGNYADGICVCSEFQHAESCLVNCSPEGILAGDCDIIPEPVMYDKCEYTDSGIVCVCGGGYRNNIPTLRVGTCTGGDCTLDSLDTEACCQTHERCHMQVTQPTTDKRISWTEATIPCGNSTGNFPVVCDSAIKHTYLYEEDLRPTRKELNSIAWPLSGVTRRNAFLILQNGQYATMQTCDDPVVARWHLSQRQLVFVDKQADATIFWEANVLKCDVVLSVLMYLVGDVTHCVAAIPPEDIYLYGCSNTSVVGTIARQPLIHTCFTLPFETLLANTTKVYV